MGIYGKNAKRFPGETGGERRKKRRGEDEVTLDVVVWKANRDCGEF